MDPLTFMHADIGSEAVTCDVYRNDADTSYGSSGPTKVGSVDVAIFAPTASAQTVIEGTDDEVSLTGLVVPEYDSNGDLVHTVEVNDEVRVQSNSQKRYVVKTKTGVPNDVDPSVWRLGMNKANSST